jgi:putative ABC transport system ATP-binding protein
MVTHELDIASYCKRMVIMRDGIVISDTPTTHRRMADEERTRLNAAERNASLDSPP